MVLIADRLPHPLADEALRDMFEARKKVFVDLLRWNVPVLDGKFELDQFDDEHAVYLLVRSSGGDHLGSARLLETLRPHILDTLFPELCAGPIPRGPRVREITRFCLDRRLTAINRRAVRNALVSALVDYAISHGISVYTGIAERSWLQQILAFGWRCRPLGLPAERSGRTVGALRIDISARTPALLARTGIYVPAEGPSDAREAA